MKMRPALILLLLSLNTVDCVMSCQAVQSQSASEANPIINAVVNTGGWNAVLIYKVVMVLIVSIGLGFIFNRAAWFRIMWGACVGFILCLIYMIVLLNTNI